MQNTVRCFWLADQARQTVRFDNGTPQQQGDRNKSSTLLKRNERPLIRHAYSDLLYIGNALDARDLRPIYDNRIGAVVDLAINEVPAQLGREIIYCRFPLHDGEGNNDRLIAIAVRTIAAMIQNDIRTLVACSAGMSRAPTIAAATIALLTGRDPDECLADIIFKAPNDVSPILWTHIKRVYNT